jgi:hypothetical protein
LLDKGLGGGGLLLDARETRLLLFKRRELRNRAVLGHFIKCICPGLFMICEVYKTKAWEEVVLPKELQSAVLTEKTIDFIFTFRFTTPSSG